MTIFICQIPHRIAPKVWSAGSDQKAIDLCENDSATFDNLQDAIAYDMNSAFSAQSPFALFSAIRWTEDQHQRIAALDAVSEAFRHEAEELAAYDHDADVWRAFDGRMVFDEAEGTVQVGNVSHDAATLAYAVMLAHDELNATFTHADV